MFIFKIELSNYKLFDKDFKLQFAPITLFTGTNNSGKSSINQILMAILDSQVKGSRIFNHLQLNNDLVKLGNYKRIVTNGNKSKNIKITLPIIFRTQSSFGKSNFLIQYEFKESDDEAITDKIIIYQEANKKTIFLSFKRNYKQEIDPDSPDDIHWDAYFNIDAITKYFIDCRLISSNFLFYDYGGISEYLTSNEFIQLRSKEIELIKWYINDTITTSDLRHFISFFTHWSYFTDILTINSSDPDKVQQHLDELNALGLTYNSMELSIAGSDFFYLHLKDFLSEIFTHINDHQYYYSSYRTISAIQERVINLPRTNSQLTTSIFSNVNKILSNKEQIGLCYTLSQYIRKWLVEMEIGDDITITSIDKSNILIDIISNGENIPLIDLGLGYRNIVMLLFTIVSNYYDNSEANAFYTYMDRPIIILEEPEMNLHPKLQSKVADLVIDANKSFDIQFILETHSEYIIRKLQYLVANKTAQPDKLLLYYFNKEDSTKCRRINFTDSGSLDKPFGKGFFDEATTLQFELYKIQSQQKN